MRQSRILAALLLALPVAVHAQSVGVGTASPDPSAILDVSSTSKGLLLPRLTQAQMQAIASPKAGLLVYNTADYKFYGYQNVSVASQNSASGTTPGVGGSSSGTGQSFTSTATTTLGTVTIYIGRGIGGTGTLAITMFTGGGNTGTNLGTITRSVTLATSPSAITFDFSALNIALTSGQAYTFSLTTASLPGTLSVAVNTNNPYGGGQYYFGNTPFSNYDMQFQVSAAGQWVPLN